MSTFYRNWYSTFYSNPAKILPWKAISQKAKLGGAAASALPYLVRKKHVVLFMLLEMQSDGFVRIVIKTTSLFCGCSLEQRKSSDAMFCKLCRSMISYLQGMLDGSLLYRRLNVLVQKWRLIRIFLGIFPDHRTFSFSFAHLSNIILASLEIRDLVLLVAPIVTPDGEGNVHFAELDVKMTEDDVSILFKFMTENKHSQGGPPLNLYSARRAF